MSILGTFVFLSIIGLVTAAGQHEEKLSKPSLLTSFLEFIGKGVEETSAFQSKKLLKFTPQDAVIYSIASVYSDNQCTSMTTAVAQRVNQCYKIAGNYTRTTAIASDKNVTTKSIKYRDAACTKSYGKPKTKTLPTMCTLVGSSYVKYSLSSVFSFRSSSAGLQIR